MQEAREKHKQELLEKKERANKLLEQIEAEMAAKEKKM